MALKEQLTGINIKQTERIKTERINQYLDFLIDPSFQGVNRLFVLPFEDEVQITSYRWY